MGKFVGFQTDGWKFIGARERGTKESSDNIEQLAGTEVDMQLALAI